jgi:hypothetical protein
MRLFKSKAFGRFARSQGITDDDLCEAIERTFIINNADYVLASPMTICARRLRELKKV